MLRRTQQCAIALALIVFGSACHAGTTVITFDNLPTAGPVPQVQVPNGYGSNATNTPDIAVAYRTFNSADNSTYQPYVDYVSSGHFGDLTSAAYAVQNGYGAGIDFTVAAGHEGTINSFDLAGYGGSDATSDFVRIVSLSNQVLWSSNDLTASGSSYTSYTPDYTFTGTVELQFGDNWNVGINNISITETTLAVPEPSSIVLAGMAMGMLGINRLRRRTAR